LVSGIENDGREDGVGVKVGASKTNVVVADVETEAAGADGCDVDSTAPIRGAARG